VNPLSWKCSSWLLLRDNQRTLDSEFSRHNKMEGLLKVTGCESLSHVLYKC